MVNINSKITYKKTAEMQSFLSQKILSNVKDEILLLQKNIYVIP